MRNIGICVGCVNDTNFPGARIVVEQTRYNVETPLRVNGHTYFEGQPPTIKGYSYELRVGGNPSAFIDVMQALELTIVEEEWSVSINGIRVRPFQTLLCKGSALCVYHMLDVWKSRSDGREHLMWDHNTRGNRWPGV